LFNYFQGDPMKKQEILNICNNIAQKNNDLISTECKLIETLGNLLPGSDGTEQNSMLIHVG
ncbi:hypothetical protein, partial [Fulvivirga kasyanovii]|uniref:hypothetical protein n=1 Tax=Fulvivirga kasyanovii TaxID=396812 RepID=UPI001C876EC3